MAVDPPSQSIWILLSKLLEQNDTELGQQTIFTALLDDNGEAAGEIGGLLADLRTLVV